MRLTVANCPAVQPFDPKILPINPSFITHKPDMLGMKQAVKDFDRYKKLLVIGHGGSITSFKALYGLLKSQSTKDTYILDTVDPDRIAELKSLLGPSETLVIGISKSGETATQMEALLQFSDYPLLFITNPTSALAAMAVELQAKMVRHPAVGGRFSGLTEVGLFPLALCGIDVELIHKTATNWHSKYMQDNPAWQAASILFQLEQQGYVDVFVPLYGYGLSSSASLIMQLCHESFGKAQKGQTYLACDGPESQHHTNQRFFGGRKNIAGLALSIVNFQAQLVNILADNLSTVPFRDGNLGMIANIPLQRSMEFERQGLLDNATAKQIPMLNLELDSASCEEATSLIAFWQLYAVYGAVLRGVDPFDQPEVEASKQLSFAMRRNYQI